ncbi:unnamed protein product [Rotaria magnacalcarata]|uniref:Protein kinase C n=2 Tax=Rotaria magnacalcarata TaxID=392030 RepID=A0A815WE18_9BILA|nr:unnamed protein product [Rotaria magnacalcarata]CAF1547884.1 unnamed protein product [Rotaria magnacalcarata]CAF1954503.1 unnamed protein product [Rotaria magnacalcarata]CAF2026945.1 unnamed protein product [Rotaria magnacalcarata]CAF3780943.1 unnamed protein product [Rotaria magnacalcarata]
MAQSQLSQELIFICLKFGIKYQSIQIDKSDPNVLNLIKRNSEDIVSKSIGSLEANDRLHHIQLFLISPDYQTPSLKLIKRASDLTPACFIEIIIWRSDQENVIPTRDHLLVEHSYKKPTYCSQCDYFMWGLIKQGKRCKVCRKDFHHQCAEHLPADCPGEYSRSSSLMTRASSNVTINSTASQSQVFTDGDMISVTSDASKGKTAKRPKIFGSGNRTNTSTKNSKLPTTSSTSSTSTSTVQTPIKVSPPVSNINQNESSTLTNKTEGSTPTSTSMNGRKNTRFSPDQTLHVNHRTQQIHVKPDRRKDIKITNCQENDGIWTATGQFGRESRHSKRAEITYDKKKFRFIQKDDQGNKHVFEIPGSDIEAYRSQSSPNILTNGTSDTKSVAPPPLAVIYQKLACLLLDTINEAVKSTNDGRMRSSFKIVRGPESDSKDFADLYDMNEKEILGMGRFGMVFGGTMRRNGVRVAIKKIQTAECSQKDRENIEQEAAYLFQLNHPGILKFEGIFDFEQHIFLVTERLETDMLNYILSNPKPKARLNEDATRFLAFQLVAAIRYLHFKNIAHCDLKPDNVLINIFPDDVVHLKVGDFGYARTIHEHSLRYTKVGTTAYLPPEVSHDQWRNARGYNKTVDMWAIGVIIFVSLTGYFPFHEEIDILPQLENIPKLFQDDLFNEITDEVKDLLRFRLLVPDAGHRMHSAGVIYHDWFQKSRNLLKSCKQLEECLEKKWLTLFFEETDSNANVSVATIEESDSN